MESTSKVQQRLRISVEGIVQGVGFRPFVYKLAHLHHLGGSVYNDARGVHIEVEGEGTAVESFLQKLQSDTPSLARIDTLTYKEISLKQEKKFKILDSAQGQSTTFVSPDIAICEACEKEMFDEKNRRYLYPFINCTECGPRYTIIENLPYDRKHTTMKSFEMCFTCKQEYRDVQQRRYHAQPISCYSCGPELFLQTTDLKKDRDTPVEKLVDALYKGESVALKGLGGFHLLCDATDQKAVQNLREKKRRPLKPFGVMFPSIEMIEEVAFVSKKERELLLSATKPIVLLRKKPNTLLCDSVAPNIDKIGVFLPYTPLHLLVFKHFLKPLIATSANISGEPIICDEKEIFEKLSDVITVALSHNREIINRCDDSVMMCVDEEPLFMRLARGYAPLSFVTPQKTKKKILALGAQQKSSISLGFENHMILSPYIGDLDSLSSMEYFEKTIETFSRLYQFTPDVIVCDKHPQYASTQWAKNYFKKGYVSSYIEVQHHYAHALSVMAEYSLQEEVLAFCFDGTGYGDDATLWGGEVLLASPFEYSRIYHLETFSLLGGEKAVKEPKRVALALLFEMMDLEEILELQHPLIDAFTPQEIKTLHIMYTKGLNVPKTSSIGRIFDAVYALCGFLDPLAYEGEAGLVIEKYARESDTQKHYSYLLRDGVISFDTMVQEILHEKDIQTLTCKFINTLAAIILDISLHHKKRSVILCGGVFQNKLLVEKVIHLFQKHKIQYYRQKQTPLNDGSISLGQAYYALYKG